MKIKIIIYTDFVGNEEENYREREKEKKPERHRS